MSDTTYDPKAEVTYRVDSFDVEDWIEEQFGFPFSIPVDLGVEASPNGDYSVTVDPDYKFRQEERAAKFIEENQEKDFSRHQAAAGTLMTDEMMNELADRGHIPEGEYVISLSY